MYTNNGMLTLNGMCTNNGILTLNGKFTIEWYSTLSGMVHWMVCIHWIVYYRVFIKYCGFFFPRIVESLSPLPRQLSAAIGFTKNCQPIGVTVHSRCVESFEGLLQRCRRGRGCSELWKNTIFPEHPVTCMICQQHWKVQYTSWPVSAQWMVSLYDTVRCLGCLHWMVCVYWVA